MLFQEDAGSTWHWLATHDLEPYIELVEDAHFDLIILNATLAGLTLANDKHSVSSLIFGTTNAVKSGIIEAENDSGMNFKKHLNNTGEFGRKTFNKEQGQF